MLGLLWGRSFLPGSDSYYHLKMALLLPDLGAIHEFPWLQWTLFRDHFVSHHLGFQVLLIPFVKISMWLSGDAVEGGKVALLLSMGAAYGLFYVLLRTLNVASPGFWIALLGWLPWHFWLRHTYVRAPIVGLPLLFLAVHFIVRGRFRSLALLAALFVTIYYGALVFLLIPFSFASAYILIDGDIRKACRLMAWSVAGLGLGFVVNPYFPENMAFLKVQLFSSGLGFSPEVGNEWKPLSAWTFFVMCSPLFLIMALSFVGKLQTGRPLDVTSFALLLLNGLLFVLTCKARRFMEYWPPFALLSAAVLFPWSLQELASWLGGAGRSTFISKVLLFFVFLLSLPNVWVARAHAAPRSDQAAIREGMNFLQNHSPADSIVFTDDWDTFPICFYYNHHNRYVVGLDPMFTKVKYPDLWDRYRSITRGESEKLFDIKTQFGADYVFVLQDHGALYRQLIHHPDEFRLIFPTNGDSGDMQPEAALFQVIRL